MGDVTTMGDEKELVIIKILNDLQEKYDINNLEVKELFIGGDFYDFNR